MIHNESEKEIEQARSDLVKGDVLEVISTDPLHIIRLGNGFEYDKPAWYKQIKPAIKRKIVSVFRKVLRKFEKW